jgi:hypothetical protein
MLSGERDRKLGDPHHIGSRGKTASQRKGRYDSGWTPSESRQRDQLMKQFCRLEGPSGNGDAYVNAQCWCSCGARLKEFPVDKPRWCRDCADPAVIP